MPTLAICQIFNPLLHGESPEGTDNCESPVGHHLALHTYDDEYDDSPYAFLNYWSQTASADEQAAEDGAVRHMREVLSQEYEGNITASIAGIHELRNIPKVDIVDTLELSSGHLVAIKKTMWLSIFQRMLKKRYASKNAESRKRQKLV